jgi:nucleotide-binding universal stress UspA family protein
VVLYDKKGALLPKTDYRGAARQQLDDLISDLAFPVESRLEEGEVVSGILRGATEVIADLILMGTQGRTGLDRLLIGSVAAEVLRNASCPVALVRFPRAKRSVGGAATAPEPVEAS